ncbi:hypothetical protein ABTM04_20345, partial [Acinetobacter baumannii]
KWSISVITSLSSQRWQHKEVKSAFSELTDFLKRERMLVGLDIALLSQQLKPFLSKREWKSFLQTTRDWLGEYYFLSLDRRHSIRFYEDEA